MVILLKRDADSEDLLVGEAQISSWYIHKNLYVIIIEMTETKAVFEAGRSHRPMCTKQNYLIELTITTLKPFLKAIVSELFSSPESVQDKTAPSQFSM